MPMTNGSKQPQGIASTDAAHVTAVPSLLALFVVIAALPRLISSKVRARGRRP